MNMRVNIRVPKGTLKKTLGNDVGEFMDEVYPNQPDIAVERLDNRQSIRDAISRFRRLKKLCRLMYDELSRIKERRCAHCSPGADRTIKELF